MSTSHEASPAAAADGHVEAARPPSKSDNLFMQIIVHPDGTVTRPSVPTVPASSGDPSAVQSRDVPLDAALGTYLRLYLPPIPTDAPSPKLPVILYLHGGGFVLFSPATAFYHASCEAMAAAVPAIVASLHYRLAQEHRLPAAYHDAAAALLWLRQNSAADPWLSAHADPMSLFLMGSSSGANIAFHAALQNTVFPVSGVIMHQPYLGGESRTASEAASEGDAMLPLEASDKLWRLALPDGAGRDHVYSNPEKSMAAEELAGLPRCLVHGSAGDPLIRGGATVMPGKFAAWLRESGKVEEVVEKTDGPGFHAAELFVPEVAEELFAAVRDFVHGAGGPTAVVGDDEPPPVGVAGAALT